MSSYQLPPIDNAKQFEQMLCDLLNEHHRTLSFKCFGKNGHQQKGIDVFSAEKKVVIQCKLKDLSRNAVMIKRELLDEIDGTLTALRERKTPIDFKQVIIATTASEHPDYDEYIAALKANYALKFDIIFWGWETLQEKISHLPSTLSKYYPHIKMGKTPEEQLRGNIDMKKRLQRDFADWLNFATGERKKRSRMIIHSSTDTHYPEHPNPHGPWFWFGAEIGRLSTKGLGFINELEELYLNEYNQWTTDKPEDLTGFRVVTAAKIKVVAFEDIVDYDLSGDEHYNCPHFYLRFNDEGTPFSDYYYQILGNDGKSVPTYIDKSTEIK